MGLGNIIHHHELHNSHDGLDCSMVMIPGGASGVVSTLYVPFRWAYTDILGHVLDVRSKFKVMNPCGSNSSHRYIGNFWFTDYSPATKLFLNIRISQSAALTQWFLGSTSW